MSVKKRINPEASDTSMLDVAASASGCKCTGTYTTCAYKVTLAYGTSCTAVVLKIDGVNVTETISSDSRKTLREELARVLKKHGYDPYYSVDNILGINTVGSVLKVVGEAELVSITNDTVKTFTKACTVTRIESVSFEIDVDAVDPVLNYDGTAETITGTWNTGEAAGLKTAIETQLGDLSLSYVSVTVTEASGAFTVTIDGAFDNTKMTIGASPVALLKVYQDWV